MYLHLNKVYLQEDLVLLGNFFLGTRLCRICVEEERKAITARTRPKKVEIKVKDHYFRTLLEIWISLDKFLDVQEANTEQEEAHGRSIQECAETHALVWKRIFTSLGFRAVYILQGPSDPGHWALTIIMRAEEPSLTIAGTRPGQSQMSRGD